MVTSGNREAGAQVSMMAAGHILGATLLTSAIAVVAHLQSVWIAVVSTT
jgi:hypothetical protein